MVTDRLLYSLPTTRGYAVLNVLLRRTVRYEVRAIRFGFGVPLATNHQPRIQITSHTLWHVHNKAKDTYYPASAPVQARAKTKIEATDKRAGALMPANSEVVPDTVH